LFKTASQINEATSENIASVKIPSANFLVYPNPAKDVLHIRSGSNVMITVTDASGKIVLTQNINGNADINIHGLQPGIYFLKNQITGEEKRF